MLRLATPFVFAIFLARSAPAQLTYDAGTAGNPPTAPSPVTQGWSESLSGAVTVTDVSPDPNAPLNAWQITDTGTGAGSYAYSASFLPSDWEASLTLRMLGGSIFITIDTGELLTDSVFEVELETVGTDVLVHRPNGPPILCPAAAGGGYHTFRFTITSLSLLLWYDGEVHGWVDWTDLGPAQYGAGLRFGTGDGSGRARFHQVVIGPTDTRILFPSLVCFGNPNSTGSAGELSLVGSEVVADDNLTLVATRLPTEPNIGYFIMGTGTNTFTPPGSAGPICVAPGIRRYLPPVQNTTQLAGGFARTVGTSGPVSGNLTAGSTWGFQAWHRDALAGTSNLTTARQLTFQ